MIIDLSKKIREIFKRSQTAMNIVITFVSRVSTALFLFLTMVIISRHFGVEAKGIFTMFFFLPELIFNIGHLGIGNSNIYYISQDKELSKKMFYNTVIQTIVMSALLSLLFLMAYWFNPNIMGKLNPVYIYWSLMLVPFIFLEKYLQSIFVGNQKFKLFNLLLFISKVVTFVITMILVYVYSQSLWWVLVSYSILTALLPLGYLIICIKEYGFKLSFDVELFKKTIVFGLKSYIICLFGYLILRADTYMLNAMRGLSDVGMYSIATNFFDGMNLLASSIALVLFPLMSGQKKQNYAILKKGIKVVMVIMIPTIILTMLFIKPIVLLLFGPLFLPAIPAFYLLSLALIFWSMLSVINQYYASIGLPTFMIFLWLGGLLLNIGLNWVFIPKYGIVAAGSSSLLAYFLLWLISYIIINNKKYKHVN